MDKILIRIAAIVAIAFMVSVSAGIVWMFFGDCDDEVKVFCPRCRHEFNISIP